MSKSDDSKKVEEIDKAIETVEEEKNISVLVNSKYVDNTESSNSSVEEEVVASEEGNFNWSLPRELKEALISKLKKESVQRDRCLVKFLDDYSKLEDDFNEILFGLSNYEEMNNFILYAEEDQDNQSATEFQDKVTLNGFTIAASEGMMYLSKNTDFLKADLNGLLDSTSMEFLTLYCQEIDTVCCHDAGIIIPMKLLIERAMRWGNVLEKSSGLAYEDIVDHEFKRYLLLIYSGEDNTPAFDWESNKFDKTRLDLMEKTALDYPNAYASKAFKEYIELLEQSEFKNSDMIDAHVRELW